MAQQVRVLAAKPHNLRSLWNLHNRRKSTPLTTCCPAPPPTRWGGGVKKLKIFCSYSLLFTLPERFEYYSKILPCLSIREAGTGRSLGLIGWPARLA